MAEQPEIDVAKIKFEFPRIVIERYINAEHEWSSMLNFIRENARSCEIRHREAPKELRIRYGLSYEWRDVGIAWYLLDQYFKGNITIKADKITVAQKTDDYLSDHTIKISKEDHDYFIKHGKFPQ